MKSALWIRASRETTTVCACNSSSTEASKAGQADDVSVGAPLAESAKEQSVHAAGIIERVPSGRIALA